MKIAMNMLKNIGKVFSISLIALVVSTISSPVYAIETGGWGGKPANPDPLNPRSSSIFIYDAELGSEIKDSWLLVNNTSTEKTIVVYSTDSTISSDGGFACEQKGIKKTVKGTGNWIEMTKSEVTLAANSTAKVPFFVHVPRLADVGEHTGCVVMELKEKPVPPSQSTGVNITTRTAIKVQVTIPGKIFKEVTFVGAKFVQESISDVIVLNIKNIGNVSFDVYGHADLVNAVIPNFENKEITKVVSLLPQQETEIRFETKMFWGGFYRIKAFVEYNDNPNSNEGVTNAGKLDRHEYVSKVIFVKPVATALYIELAILTALVVIAYLVVKRVLNTKKINKTWVSYTVKSSDDLQSIAASREVSWHTLTRVNKIRAPYTVKAGQSIKVPPKK